MALPCVGCLEPFSASQVEHLGVIEVDKYWLNAPLLSISLVRGGVAASHLKALRYWIFSVLTSCRFNYINILDKDSQLTAAFFKIELGLFQ